MGLRDAVLYSKNHKAKNPHFNALFNIQLFRVEIKFFVANCLLGKAFFKKIIRLSNQN